MTEQMFVFTCRDVRKHAFDFRRGELQAVEQRRVEDHLAHCQSCQDYLARLEGMLDGAATHDFTPSLDREALFGRILADVRNEVRADADEDRRDEPPRRLDPDAVFGRITAQLAGHDAPPVSPNVLAFDRAARTEESDRGSDDEQAPTRRPVALYVVAALAAGVLIGIALGFLYPRERLAPPSGVAQQEAPGDTEPDGAAPMPGNIAFAELTVQPPPADVEDVRVFGEATADWTIRTQGARRKLELQEGALLVEFVPRADHTLEVVAERFTVHVTGTIFYVSADDGLVGVVTGSVEVTTPTGESVALGDGQEWVDGEGVRKAASDVPSGVALHLDIASHRDTLAALRAQRPEPPPEHAGRDKQVEAPRPPMSEEVVRTPRPELRAAADRALRAGRYDVAAQYYERMVEEFSAADPANASLRLDLARIYVRHLRRERRALVHLQRFVEDRPQDPLTPAARIELCRIASSVGEVLLECEP